jgi:hypothetical protein
VHTRNAGGILVMTALVGAVIAGCASSNTHHDAGATNPKAADRADTPESAAVGFFKSINSLGRRGDLRFGCLPDGDFGWFGIDEPRASHRSGFFRAGGRTLDRHRALRR